MFDRRLAGRIGDCRSFVDFAAPVLDSYLVEVEGVLRMAREALAGARRVFVLTGAGISAEAGLPVYRGPGGIYEEKPELPAVLSASGWRNDPDAVWRYLDGFRQLTLGSEPSAAHRILAAWEQSRRFEDILIATQNIDGLHQAAGSTRVSEVHGSVWRMARPKTNGDDFTEDEDFSSDAEEWLLGAPDRENLLRKWSLENRQTVWEDRRVPFPSIPPYRDDAVRPDILWFGEAYGDRLAWVEWFLGGGADAVIVIGCSGGVSLLDRLLQLVLRVRPARIIQINPHHDAISVPHLHLPLGAAEALERLEDLR